MAVPCRHGTDDSAEDPHASGQVRVDARNQGGVDRFRPFRLHLHHLAGALDADGERGRERDAGLGMVLPVHFREMPADLTALRRMSTVSRWPI